MSAQFHFATAHGLMNSNQLWRKANDWVRARVGNRVPPNPALDAAALLIAESLLTHDKAKRAAFEFTAYSLIEPYIPEDKSRAQ